MRMDKLTNPLQQALGDAQSLAVGRDHSMIEPAHLFLARSNDQQLAGAIIFLLTASIVALNFFTDILLATIDPRVRKSIVR